LLLAGCLGLFVAGTAGAQTTSTSSTVPTSSTTVTSTPAVTLPPPTTSTTGVDPCTGRPCTAQPPAALLSGAAGEVRMDTSSACWRDPATMAQGTAQCFSALIAPPGATLVVQQGETLSLRYVSPMAPTRAVFSFNDTSLMPGIANPTTFRADFPVGTTRVFLITGWLQGEVTYAVTLDVRAAATPPTTPPATPQTGPLSLTG
jgi:hypothetical protein